MRCLAVPRGLVLLVGLLVTGCAGTMQNHNLTADNAGLSMTKPKPPIDPNDPWRNDIAEAAQRFNIPEVWIRAVMQRESGGRAMVDGQPIVSPAGAIGLMQVMPATYEDLRERYSLGPNVADPHDNIMAGTAYLREMYEQFGSPGFLAAYNCGPACYAAARAGRQRLPQETRVYLSALAPAILRARPGPSTDGTTMVASAEPAPHQAEPAPHADPTPRPPRLAARTAIRTGVREGIEVADAGDLPLPARRPSERAGHRDGRSVVRVAAREPEPRVLFRFVPQSGRGCGSLQGNAQACQPGS